MLHNIYVNSICLLHTDPQNNLILQSINLTEDSSSVPYLLFTMFWRWKKSEADHKFQKESWTKKPQNNQTNTIKKIKNKKEKVNISIVNNLRDQKEEKNREYKPEMALTPWKQVLKKEVFPTWGTELFSSPFLAVSCWALSSAKSGVVVVIADGFLPSKAAMEDRRKQDCVSPV